MRLTVYITRHLMRLIPERCATRLREESAHYDIYPIEDLLASVPTP